MGTRVYTAGCNSPKLKPTLSLIAIKIKIKTNMKLILRFTYDINEVTMGTRILLSINVIVIAITILYCLLPLCCNGSLHTKHNQ